LSNKANLPEMNSNAKLMEMNNNKAELTAICNEQQSYIAIMNRKLLNYWNEQRSSSAL